VPSALLSLLDRQEARLLRVAAALEGRLGMTHYATYVAVDHLPRPARPRYPVSLQVQFIKDSFRGHPKFRELQATLPPERQLKVEVERSYAFKIGGGGLAFVWSGFSVPEADFMWIDGCTGVLQFEQGNWGKGYDLVLTVAARPTPGRDDQVCTIEVGGRLHGPFRIGAAEQRLVLPLTEPTDSTTFTIIQLAYAEQVRDASGKVIDPRHLGMRVLQMAISKRTDDAQ
jgi:hypothetical protein